ncbi:hypothetical protein [Saccharomonospora sp.]|uniref:hypothetical protein n=1 Tax=Saccharomonospora sp. TaxID=33913 RepID=UPI00260D44A4|nr:hypothetical protein [Saccharomonospora sp.]
MTERIPREAAPYRFDDFVQQRLDRLLRYATALGCGAGTVRSHISRALTNLRAAEAAHARTTETVKGAHS